MSSSISILHPVIIMINNDSIIFIQPHTGWIKALIFRHAVLTMTGVGILSARFSVMGSAAPTFQVVDNPHSFVNGTVLRVR